MKRLGTRLGVLGGVIGLAAMAITQAQKDYSSKSQSLELTQLEKQLTPPPIGAGTSEWPAPPDTQVVRGNDEGVAPIPSTMPVNNNDAIQLAAHQQPTDGGAALPPTTFSMPQSDASTTADPAPAPSSGFSLPGTLPPTGIDTAGPTPAPASAVPDASAPADLTLPSTGPETVSPSPLPSAGVAADAPPVLPDTFSPGSSSESIGSSVVPQAASAPAQFDVPHAAVPSIESNVQAAPQSAPEIGLPDEAFAGFGNATSAPKSASPSAQPAIRQPSPSNEPVAGGISIPTPSVSPQVAPTPAQPPAIPAESLTAGGFEIETADIPSAEPSATYTPGAQAPSARVASSNPQPRALVAGPQSTQNLSMQVRTPSRGSVDPNLAAVEPGNRALEGVQAPSVTLHKRAPEEVNVGKPATFAIQVRNTGSTEVLNVVIHDAIPKGTELLEAVPQPQINGPMLTWNLGDLQPRAERTITLQLLPHVEGELGSIASMSFQSAASVRTISTRPELKIVQRAPKQVLVGQQVEVEIEVSNPGTGTAYGVVLQEDVPDGLEHPKGRQLDNLLGNIEPGQSRIQRLSLTATSPGVVNNLIQLISEDEVVAKDALPIEVVSPQLAVQLEGPTRRFLERRATYSLKIANTGTATATNIDVVAYLDRGLSFVSTEYKGQYDAARHAVFWSLAELPIGEVGEVPLVLLPIEPGKQIVRMETQADLGIEAKSEKPIVVDTLAEISFSVNDDQDPIEIGAITTYAIKVTNSGSRADSNVQLQVAIPPGLEYVGSDQQGNANAQGVVTFGKIPQMSPQDEYTFRLQVRGRQEGTHVLKAVMTSDQSRVPVTKEESTLVYSDQ